MAAARGLGITPIVANSLKVVSITYNENGPPFSADVVTQLLQRGPASIRVEAISGSFLETKYIGSLIPSPIDASLTFQTNSLPVTYQVVPEPSTWLLFAVGLVLTATRRGSRR